MSAVNCVAIAASLRIFLVFAHEKGACEGALVGFSEKLMVGDFLNAVASTTPLHILLPEMWQSKSVKDAADRGCNRASSE